MNVYAQLGVLYQIYMLSNLFYVMPVNKRSIKVERLESKQNIVVQQLQAASFLSTKHSKKRLVKTSRFFVVLRPDGAGLALFHSWNGGNEAACDNASPPAAGIFAGRDGRSALPM